MLPRLGESGDYKKLAMTEQERSQLRFLAVLSLCEDLDANFLSKLSEDSFKFLAGNFEDCARNIHELAKNDATSFSAFPGKIESVASITAQEPLVVSGIEAVRTVFSLVDPSLNVELLVSDGDHVKEGAVLARIKGDMRSVLAGERTALNFLQRCCGISTLTSRFVSVASKHGVDIYDTRKTAPGWRFLDKFAVRCGGGKNHRLGLHDQILVKSTHVDLAGGVSQALRSVFSSPAGSSQIVVEVEVRNLEELKAALEFPVDVVLLDNMSPSLAREAIQLARSGQRGRSPPQIEISGGINLSNIEAFCSLNPERIAVGMLTHSPPAARIHMKVSAPSQDGKP
ncbi:carboxylating nicotinate-nucleotide diphosphorylase [Candidatus Woesearchaeota archaeon]|nr:MAG: carboxylating nicotinate-nucleotide diphosphorylase [Candidatus Woesearchaeota archaeon]